MLFSFVSALSSPVISIASPLLRVNVPSLAILLPSHCLCPVFSFILHTFSPAQLPAVGVNMANCLYASAYSPLLSAAEPSFRDVHSGEKLPVSFLIHFFFLISPSILSDRQCLHFFPLQTFNSYFCHSVPSFKFFPQAVTTMMSKVTTPYLK